MTIKTDAKEKITHVELASDCAMFERRMAVNCLDGDGVLNGFGIIHDPSDLRAKFLDARHHIDKALAYLADVKWPTNEDYDNADGKGE